MGTAEHHDRRTVATTMRRRSIPLRRPGARLDLRGHPCLGAAPVMGAAPSRVCRHFGTGAPPGPGTGPAGFPRVPSARSASTAWVTHGDRAVLGQEQAERLDRAGGVRAADRRSCRCRSPPGEVEGRRQVDDEAVDLLVLQRRDGGRVVVEDLRLLGGRIGSCPIALSEVVPTAAPSLASLSSATVVAFAIGLPS